MDIHFVSVNLPHPFSAEAYFTIKKTSILLYPLFQYIICHLTTIVFSSVGHTEHKKKIMTMGRTTTTTFCLL